MNNTLETIKNRYSCRNFKEDSISDDLLNLIANAAIESPSGLNRQAWKIIVVKNLELIKQMEEEGLNNLKKLEDQTMYQNIIKRGGNLFYHAPCIFVVAIDNTQDGAVLDAGIVCQTIALSSTSLGLGNVICGLARLAFVGQKAEYFKEKLGFPKNYEFGISVLIGYENIISKPHEPDKSKIVFIN